MDIIIHDHDLLTIIAFERLLVASGFFVLTILLLNQLRKRNGITGALAFMFLSLTVVFGWSVALLGDAFPSREASLLTIVVALFVLIVAITNLFYRLLLSRGE